MGRGYEGTTREDFNNIPTERTFLTVKLFLDEGQDVTGAIFYNGPLLKGMGLSNIKGRECKTILDMVQRDVRRAMDVAGANAQMMELLKEVFGSALGDDDDESNSNEGTSEQSTADSGVSRDGEGGPVRTVGRTEDATDSPSD